MLKKIVWPSIAGLSIVLSLVFILGFATSINISKAKEGEAIENPEEKIEEPVEKLEDTSSILIMGDSIAFGIGDEENLGIGGRYRALLEDEEVELTNIAVPGYETEQLLNLVEMGENNSSISQADLIIISIGGNDLNRLEYEDSLTMNIVFQEGLKKYIENLDLLVKEIRGINPDAQLAFIGLYDPYGIKEPGQSRLLLEWNYQTRLIVDSDFKFVFVPNYEKFQYHLDEYLSLDEFHPSGAGYEAIAEELHRILK